MTLPHLVQPAFISSSLLCFHCFHLLHRVVCIIVMLGKYFCMNSFLAVALLYSLTDRWPLQGGTTFCRLASQQNQVLHDGNHIERDSLFPEEERIIQKLSMPVCSPSPWSEIICQLVDFQMSSFSCQIMFRMMGTAQATVSSTMWKAFMGDVDKDFSSLLFKYSKV